jgi:hypothetical protein
LMKKLLIYLFSVPAFTTFISLLYARPCGFWDGLTKEGISTGGRVICRGFLLPMGYFYESGGLMNLKFIGIIVNYVLFLVITGFIFVVVKLIKKKAINRA